MMRMFRWVCRGVLLLCLLLAPRAAIAAGVQPDDFTMRGIAVGATEKEMLAAFGTPDFDREYTRWGVPLKTYTFPGGFEVTLDRRTLSVAEMKTTNHDYTARLGIRYGATSYYIQKIYGQAKRQKIDGLAYYVYENPAASHTRLLLEADFDDGSLRSFCITSLPLTAEEADAWQTATGEDDATDGESLQNVLAGQAEIDTSALPAPPEVRLGGLEP